MQGGESWASAFLVVVGIEKNCLDLQFMVCYISCKQREILLEYSSFGFSKGGLKAQWNT